MTKNTWYPVLVFGLVTLVGCAKKEAAEAPAEQAPAATAPAAPAQNVIPAEQLQTGAAGLRGQKVTVKGVTVQSLFGTKGFWIQLPNKNPFLVRTEGAVPAANSSVDVTGTVTAMSEATTNEWVTAGSITENDRPLAEFASDYIVADAVAPATP